MAAKFVFKLEAVRGLRQRAEDEQKRVVARKNCEVMAVEDDIRQCGDRIERQRDGIRAAQQVAAVLDMDALRAGQVHLAYLGRKVAAARQQAQELGVELERERVALAAAAAQRKALDKLRQRQWARHQARLRRLQQAEDDENAAQRFIRRMGGGAT